MFPYDALHRVEAKPGSLPDSLGGEEWFEYVGLNFRGNSWTVVADLDHNTIVLAKGSHAQLAFTPHGVNGVIDDGGPHLIEFAAERIHEARSFLIIPLHSLAAFEFVIQDGQRRLEGFYDIDVLDGRLIHEGVFLDRAH